MRGVAKASGVRRCVRGGCGAASSARCRRSAAWHAGRSFSLKFLPKQLQLMGFLILAKKQTLLQRDFKVCLPLSPFYWILFRHDFQVCLPLSPFYWILFVMISRFVSLCLPFTGSCVVMISRFVSLRLPSTGSLWLSCSLVV